MFLAYKDGKYMGTVYCTDYETACIRAALYWGPDLEVKEV